MKKLLILLCFFLFSDAYEYIYPVMSTSATLYCIYQKDLCIELLSWNPETKSLNKVLSNRFFPSQVSIVPDNYGFSFIDQGVIWVKSYAKRSPIHLEIPFPVRGIDYIYWKNSSSCYFSAQKNDEYALFELDRYGNFDCLLSEKKYDFLYPQEVNEFLFCITRDQRTNSYYLIRGSYPHIMHSARSFNKPVDNVCDIEKIGDISVLDYNKDCKILYSFNFPVAFLQMISVDSAYVIAVPHTVTKQNTILYAYMNLERTEQGWSTKELFTFSLPSFRNGIHISESVLPFLPRYNQELHKIVYTSLEEQYFTVFEYDLLTGISRQLSFGTDAFAPCFFQDKIIWGGEVEQNQSTTKKPRMWLLKGHVCLDLPFVSMR